VAEHLGVHFGWTLEMVAGAGHVDQKIFDRATSLLAV
jgi:hypothetical protein